MVGVLRQLRDDNSARFESAAAFVEISGFSNARDAQMLAPFAARGTNGAASLALEPPR
jgi:hypothetical protein